MHHHIALRSYTVQCTAVVCHVTLLIAVCVSKETTVYISSISVRTQATCMTVH
jgi:hypothetical protein